MNRKKSDSLVSSSNDYDGATGEDQFNSSSSSSSFTDNNDEEDERDFLIQPDGGDKGKNKMESYLEVERSVSPNLVKGFGPLKLFCKQRRIRNTILSILIIAFTIFLFFLVWYQHIIRLYFGFLVFSPYDVTNVTIVIHDKCDFKNIRNLESQPFGNYIPEPRLPSFTDIETMDFSLSRNWNVIPADKCINTSNLNSNVCIEEYTTTGSHKITCLPSFMIIGFEKCSTTELLLWLSYHPNLLGKWSETRFFSKITSSMELESKWHEYVSSIPVLPNGRKSIGKYWSYEKTPSYILNNATAKSIRSIMPNIHLIIMVRNPTKRAYSAFAMYTQLVQYNKFKDTWNMGHLTYNSVVIRNLDKPGVVKFSIAGGPGGSIVPPESLAPMDQGDRWTYIAFPPTPQDFHDFLLYDRNFSYGSEVQFNFRQRRVVMEGYYSKYIKDWQLQFPTKQILVIPMELLWNENTMENLNVLQRKMGIPVFDYKRVTSFDEETNRYELNSASTFFLDKAFNTGNKMLPMLPESKKLLDDIYCESNRELKAMLGGTVLKGYSCSE